MSAPLSPLNISRQNSRVLSSDCDDVIGKDNIDGVLGVHNEAENSYLSPGKLVDDSRANATRTLSFGSSNGTLNPGLDPEDSPRAIPSSPFRFDGRDDTVDMQQLLRYRQASLGLRERSATPRKRSFEHVPESQDDSAESEERYRKGTGRRDVPDINVYMDEDSGYNFDRSTPEGVRQDVASSMVEEKHNEGMSTVLRENNGDTFAGEKDGLDYHDTDDDAMVDDESHDPLDDTCLSTFSAVPNVDMTQFAGLRSDSPFKGPRPLPNCPVKVHDHTQRHDIEPGTPITAKRSPRKNALIDMSSPVGSPAPRKRNLRDHEDAGETPNLLDFTDQSSFFPRRQRYSIQHERYSPSRRSPLRNPREPIRSPAKVSLLDFEIPSAPTPRSIPTITPRELESLKSGFLSEISSLKATLSGKEAEVSSLKQAVSDAERRVGEALEEVRNVAARKEALEVDQAEWQRRGREMEEVLRSVKADIVEGEMERERLTKKVDESEKSKEQLESRMVELESQLAAARKAASSEGGASGNAIQTKTAEETANEVQDAVEKVARELHTLYKNKHETKVAALKKSYEGRWEKRVREAESKLKAAAEENERLRAERDATMLEASRPDTSMMMRENEEHETAKRVLEAQIKGLQQEMAALKGDSEQLRAELKIERAEKGELVAAVDEWLAIQNQPPQQSNSHSPTPPQAETPEPALDEIEPATEELKGSADVDRRPSSGIRGPSSGSNNGEKRIPRIGAPGSRHGRGNSGGKSGIAVFTPGRSGIMSSIERMGRGGV